MCGRLSPDHSGQLALLDACVFFVTALLISGIIISISRSDSAYSTSDAEHGPDVDALLRVFLQSSLCQSLSIDIGFPVEIPENTPVISSLATELRALSAGIDIVAFKQLNDLLIDIVVRLCSGAYLPHILAAECGSDLNDPVLALPSVPEGAPNLYASSAIIASSDTLSHLLVLVLCPSSSAEAVGV